MGIQILNPSGLERAALSYSLTGNPARLNQIAAQNPLWFNVPCNRSILHRLASLSDMPNKARTFRWLIDHGADPHRFDENGDSVLEERVEPCPVEHRALHRLLTH